MSTRRVRVPLTQRDPSDAPENVEFVRFCLEQGIDIAGDESAPVAVDLHTAEDEGDSEKAVRKDEALETDARRAAQAALDEANAAIDEKAAAEASGSEKHAASEPDEVAGLMKRAAAWVGGVILAGWSITVKSFAEGATKAVMDSTKGDGG